MEDFEIRPFQPGDEQQIVRLLNLVFKGWPRFDIPCSPLDHWKWKHLDNPLGESVIVVAESGNEIIGCIHNVLQNVKVGKAVNILPHGADAAVHPDFRKMGVNTQVRKLRSKLIGKLGALHHYSVSANPILIRRNIREGRPRFPFPVMIYAKIQDVDRHIQAVPTENPLTKRYGFHLMNMANKIKNTLTNPIHGNRNIKISTVETFDDRINILWENISDHYDFMVVRNRDRLNWRFLDTRGGEFIVRQAEEHNKILGYIVIRVNKHLKHYPIGYIVDLLNVPGRLDAADKLVKDALNLFEEYETNVITGLFVQNHPIKKVLSRNGFLNSMEKVNIFLGAEELNELNNSVPSKIHFTLGDFDHV